MRLVKNFNKIKKDIHHILFYNPHHIPVYTVCLSLVSDRVYTRTHALVWLDMGIDLTQSLLCVSYGYPFSM